MRQLSDAMSHESVSSGYSLKVFFLGTAALLRDDQVLSAPISALVLHIYRLQP